MSLQGEDEDGIRKSLCPAGLRAKTPTSLQVHRTPRNVFESLLLR